MDWSLVIEVWKKISMFFYAIGFFSEVIIIGLSIFLLYTNIYSIVFYLIGIIGSFTINQVLKQLIQEKRPPSPMKFLNSDKFENKTMVYGMPSGHSQHLFFSIFYLYLSIKDFYPWILLISSSIGIMTIAERWYFRNHTFKQLMVGAMVGSMFAFVTVYIRDKLSPILSHKIKSYHIKKK